MLDKCLENYDSFYFIGIGGVSMSALAKLLRENGKKVAGSDLVYSEYTEDLERLGIKVDYGDDAKSIADFDAVVYTDAIKDTNKQLCQAFSLGKRVIPRGLLLSCVCGQFGKVIAVAGCHGKTTCSAMLAHIFRRAEMGFACHIGGRDSQFANYYRCGSDWFITEACEYKKNFLYIKPNVALILNSDADHLECYGNEQEIKKSYLKFADGAKTAVCLFGDLPVEGAVTFGFDDRADYFAKCIKNNGGMFSFLAYEGESLLGKVSLSVFGKHNVLNALAAIAAARVAGLSFDSIREGLADFKGVERRFENLGKFHGCTCIADYAHHPNEIRAALKTAALISSGDLYVIFQPHTYSRTKNLFKQFVKVLSPVKNLLIYKTFAAREYFDDAGCAFTLSQAIKKSRYADSPHDLALFLNNAGEGDTALFLGAGDVYYIAKSLISD